MIRGFAKTLSIIVEDPCAGITEIPVPEFRNAHAALKLSQSRMPPCADDARSNGPPRWASLPSGSPSVFLERRDQRS